MFNQFSSGVSRELTWIVTSLSIFILFGMVTGLWVATLVGYLVFYMARQLWSVHRFEKWMKGDGDYPTSGFWSELSYLVFKKKRSLEKYLDRHQYRAEQFKAASMSVPIAIISVDKHYKVEWLNSAAKVLLKVKSEETGQYLERMVRQPDFVNFLKEGDFSSPLFLPSFLGNQRVYRCDILNYHKDHLLILIDDVNELYNLAQIQKDFVANASHELRTPLTVVNGYLEMMIGMEDVTPSKWQKPLKQMYNQSLRMQSIIDGLLTLSRIESSANPLFTRPVSVDSVLLNMETDMRQLYGETYAISFEIQPGLVVMGEEDALKSVFENVISNAFRYTPVGGKVSVRWFKTKKGQARFEVVDSGIGIEKEHIKRLTERFYRVDTARSRETGGTGLGLAIVKHILIQYGSQLTIKSKAEKGSTFSVEFTPLQD